MRHVFLISLAALMVATGAQAQSRIFRCGNSYTNDVAEAKAKGCKVVEGGNVTVVEAGRGNSASGAVRVAAAAPSLASGGQRVDADQQRSRDSEARSILETELKKAEARQAELLKEYNNGEPEKLGPEHRNPQKYIERVAELKASIARNENDIAGLRRELGRAGVAAAASK